MHEILLIEFQIHLSCDVLSTEVDGFSGGDAKFLGGGELLPPQKSRCAHMSHIAQNVLP